MPIYEYACDKCGHEFEAEQRITDDPLKTCPACRGRKVRRLISRTSFVLKGGGWYSDLYSSGAATKAKSDDKDTGGEAKPSESKPDKPDKPDSKASKKKGSKAAA